MNVPDYLNAGVDVAEGQQAVSRIRSLAATTHDRQVLSGVGGFGGLYDLAGFEDPVLVSGADGVGTKVEIARLAGRLSTIGIDCVAMCVNDVLCHGARPLFFLDYLAVDRLDAGEAAVVVRGVAEGCRLAGCSLLGGETAEMPGVYKTGRFDLAGFVVAAVERERIIDGSAVRPGMAVVGIASSGLHSNGYSLVRSMLEIIDGVGHLDDEYVGGRKLVEVLLEPTRIYARALGKLFEAVDVRGAAHITGGGWYENLPRMLPEGLGLDVSPAAIPLPGIYAEIERRGVDREEMYHTFNMGLGMAVIVDDTDVDHALQVLNECGETAARIGTVTNRGDIRRV